MRKYGLIGYPLGHSFSKSFFTDKFEKEKIDAEYLNFEIDQIEHFKDIVKDSALMGLNVTIPYKREVLSLLDEISPEAKEIGAVNVIQLIRSNQQIKLVGFNSDIFGFRESIKPLLQPHHKRALILGTGGASKAIKLGLEQLKIETQYVSRKGGEGILTYEELTKEVIYSFHIIVNCTPLGTFPKTEFAPDIPYQYLTAKHLLYDLVYNPEKTLFLRQGEEKGCIIKNGLEMLHLQAIKAWEIWNEEK